MPAACKWGSGYRAFRYIFLSFFQKDKKDATANAFAGKSSLPLEISASILLWVGQDKTKIIKEVRKRSSL